MNGEPKNKEWTTRPLGAVAAIERGKFDHRPRNDPAFYGGTVPFVQTGDVAKSGGRIRTFSQTLNARGLSVSRLFPRGTILLTIAANIAETGILQFDSAFPDSIVGLTPTRDICGPYLEYFLRTQKALMNERAPRGTQKNINIQFLKPWPVTYPAMLVQEKIAAVLWKIQRAIEVEQNLVAASRELKQCAMHSLFTSGLSRGPKKETQWGFVPTAWEVCKLETLVDSIDYGLSEAIPKEQPPQGVKIVSTADITKNGTLLYQKIRRVETTDAVAERLHLQTGDLLFNWRNSQELIGKTAVFEEQAEPHIFASFILRIRCTTSRLHNHFLQYLMNHYRETGVFVTLSRRAVNQANYNRNEISVLSIPVPPIQEQREIATILQTTDRKISVHERQRAALSDLFQTTLHQLMTAQIRVDKLDIDTSEVTTAEANGNGR